MPTPADDGSKSALAKIVDDLNLPKLIAGPAGDAISRLIAGAADIPAEWFKRVAQSIQDKTEAKSVVSKAVAEAAANLAKSDPELIQRATHVLLTKELRRQSNKETIAKKAIEIINDESTEQASEQKQKIEDDWLNVFERFAEDASSERLQDLWARVLAGEIRKPRTFALQTLRFIAELDERTAKLFEKNAASIFNGELFYRDTSGSDIRELIELEAAGLLFGATGTVSQNLTIKTGRAKLSTCAGSIFILTSKNTSLTFVASPLTRVGKEVYKLVHASDEMEAIKTFAKLFERDGVEWIKYKGNDSTSDTIDLWEKKPTA